MSFFNFFRINDGKCDPAGRVFAGTMDQGYGFGTVKPRQGALYNFGKNQKVRTLATEIGIANGLAWSEDSKTFYYIDSLAYTVDAFDYDLATGDISKYFLLRGCGKLVWG